MSHSFFQVLLESEAITDQMSCPDSAEYRREATLQSECLKKLKACLGAENWSLLDQYITHRNAVSAMESDHDFLLGFRYGALCMLETFH